MSAAGSDASGSSSVGAALLGAFMPNTPRNDALRKNDVDGARVGRVDAGEFGLLLEPFATEAIALGDETRRALIASVEMRGGEAVDRRPRLELRVNDGEFEALTVGKRVIGCRIGVWIGVWIGVDLGINVEVDPQRRVKSDTKSNFGTRRQSLAVCKMPNANANAIRIEIHCPLHSWLDASQLTTRAVTTQTFVPSPIKSEFVNPRL